MALTSKQLEDLRELHAEGCGRNEIARRLSLPPVAVSRAAESLGLAFDRTQMQAATTARLADLAEMRSLLAVDLTRDAMRLREQMWSETTVYSFGGKDNEYNDHVFAEAPAAEKRALMSTAGMAIDRAMKLAPAEVTGGTENAKSMLDKLAEGIAAVAEWNAEAPDEGAQDSA